MDARFIVNRQGRDFVLYSGLLDEAHKQGLKRISTVLVQVPNDGNGHMAIVTAEVETDRGTYAGVGDASPQNVARPMVPHILRLAETRAKARALRDAVNVGVAALEELGADPDQEHDGAYLRAGTVAPVPPTRPAHVPTPRHVDRARGPYRPSQYGRRDS